MSDLAQSLESLQVAIHERMHDLALAHSQVAALRKRLLHLLAAVGEPGQCNGPTCGADVMWVQHLNGKRISYDLDGANHFNSCPDTPTVRRLRRC